ncbi:hypothetical protein Nepgr_029661 [Nepenthes gracilis]|uniref:Uncharacterized protein n=1 Tax=Nepenthes gracilis TaxID=150966 RepID=A0AAD3TEN5_NEPGR|nr:hypothetical protein Nepgr_029661 [Nepenthes gracilis]
MVGVNVARGVVLLSEVILIQSSTIFSLVDVVRGDVLFYDGVNGRQHNQLAFLSCGLVLPQRVSVAHGDPLVVRLLSASGRFKFVAPFDRSSLAVSSFMICGRSGFCFFCMFSSVNFPRSHDLVHEGARGCPSVCVLPLSRQNTWS